MKAPTSDQLRNRIDQGETGEKVAMPDPATVPLGTDAEAGGSPPTPQELALDAKSTPTLPNSGPNRPRGMVVYAVLGVAVAAGLIILVVSALS